MKKRDGFNHMEEAMLSLNMRKPLPAEVMFVFAVLSILILSYLLVTVHN